MCRGWLAALLSPQAFLEMKNNITVVKHMLPGEGDFPRSSLSSLFSQGSELAGSWCLGFSGSPWAGPPFHVHLRESEPL